MDFTIQPDFLGKELNDEFPKRMFRYFYRIHEKYETETERIEAVVVLLNETGDKDYSSYVYEYGKTKLVYNYCFFWEI